MILNELHSQKRWTHIPKTSPGTSFIFLNNLKQVKGIDNAAVTNFGFETRQSSHRNTRQGSYVHPSLIIIFHQSQGAQILDDDVDFTEWSTCRPEQRCVVLVALMTVTLRLCGLWHCDTVRNNTW